MPSLGDLFGKGSAAEQLFVWGFLQQVVSSLATPAFNELTYAINRGTQTLEVDPSDAAAAVARNLLDMADGKDAASKYGLDAGKFERMVAMALHAPGVGEAVAAFQRGLIETGGTDPQQVGLHNAYADAAVHPDWWPILDKLAVAIPTTGEVMNAWLEGQITEDEARKRYLEAGGDPTWFQTAFNSNGAAPTPDMLGVMLNRGIITQGTLNADGTSGDPTGTSYTQGFLEGPWRNKWLAPMLQLRTYRPPPRTITAMFNEGTLTKDEAVKLLVDNGLDADLAAKYVQSGTSQKTATAKDLTQSQIVTLYEDQLIPNSDAAAMLAAIGYDTEDAAFILQLADLRRSISSLNTLVGRIQTLYVGHKITRATASDVLTQAGVPVDQITDVLAIWDLEAAANVKTLTEGQVTGAFHYKVIDQATAIAQLTWIGYSAHDAWVVLSTREHAPLPDEPPAGPPPIPGS